MLYNVELVNAKVKDAPKVVGTCPTAHPPRGQRYSVNNMYTQEYVSWIWHPYGIHGYQQVPANSWAEVVHEADPFGDENYGAWFQYAPGSGVYFHVGKTWAFQEHQDAYTYFGVNSGDYNEGLCRKATAKGYDSIQFVAHVDHVNYQCDTHNTGNPGLAYMGLEIVAVKLVGTYACGTAGGAPSVLKAGWQASQPCNCDNSQKHTNCKGVPTLSEAVTGVAMEGPMRPKTAPELIV